MNKYEQIFFSKYITEWSEVKYIVHEHFIVILNKLILTLVLFVLIPLLFYYESVRIQSLISFKFLEIYLILIYIKIIYDIFNRYNDAWIITNVSVVDFKWALFHIKVNTVDFESIEWIEVVQKWIIDKLLSKWTLKIHKMWEETVTLNEAKIPFEALEEIQKMKEEKAKWNENKIEKDKFELVLEALTWVVNEYISHNWIRKNLSNKEELEEVLEKDWTLDLR